MRLGLDWCTQLSRITGVDSRAIWQWAFLERVSTGLFMMFLRDPHGEQMLAVASQWTGHEPDRCRPRVSLRLPGQCDRRKTPTPSGPTHGARKRRDSTSCTFPITSGASWAPLALLGAIAQATKRIRVGSLVLNNDFQHPVQLAREIAAIDHFSGGRVELGLGAGHSFTEYKAIGLPFEPPADRKARLAEAVEILRALLDGEAVTYTGRFYQLDGVRTMRALQDRLPILVGVNGTRALTHAAQHADMIGLTMLGRTLEDGQRHEARWEPDRIDRTIAHIRDAAAAPISAARSSTRSSRRRS